eukprot:926780-Prymnesium_polylepis.1
MRGARGHESTRRSRGERQCHESRLYVRETDGVRGTTATHTRGLRFMRPTGPQATWDRAKTSSVKMTRDHVHNQSPPGPSISVTQV